MTTTDLNLSRQVILNVDTFEDQNDGNPANGLSLRDAIFIANNDRDNEYLINLEAGTYDLPVGSAFDINNNITIIGVDSDTESTIIDGSLLNEEEDIFSLESFQQSILSLENITLQNSPSAAIRLFAPSAKLNLQNSIITNNQNSGIISQGTAYIEDSMILENFSVDGAGGIQNIGTGVMKIVNSTIAGNVSQNGAGGIINDFIAPTSEEIFGGSGDLTVVNSTISNNVSLNGDGGGIFARKTPPEDEEDLADVKPTKLTVINSTIVENRAANGAGIFSEDTVLFNNFTIVQNSIIANNNGSNDVQGIFNLASSNNLIGVGDSNSNFLDGVNNVVGTDDNPIDPQLGPLQDNGGTTLTYAPQADSPVINAGNNAFTENRDLFTIFPLTDQTGEPRINDETVDLGSYEFRGDTPGTPGAPEPGFSNTVVLNVDTFEDQNDGGSDNGLSLRDAILIANADPTKEYTINLPAGTYNLTIKNVLLPPTDESADDDTLFQSRLGTGDLDITGNITIIGSDRNTTIIDASGLREEIDTTDEDIIGDRIFDVLSATTSGSLTNGQLTVRNLKIENGLVGDNNIDTITNGGAVNTEEGTNTTFINSVIANSETSAQGGAINNQGTLLLKQTIVDGNNSGDNAGGIYNTGTLTIRDSSIINNIADAAAVEIIEGGGGGILNESGATLDLINTTISGNRSASGANQDGPGDGGGGLLSRGDTTVVNSTIVNNSAQVGSGIYSETTTANTLLINTIVAANEGSPDLDGFFREESRFNLIGNGNGVLLNGVNDNLVGDGSQPLDPVISPLQDNGGPTPTHALLAGSPAIDTGDNNVTNVGNFFPDDPPLDQRGSQRISNGNIDIGSYEVFVPSSEIAENNSSVNSEIESSDSLFNTPIIRFRNTVIAGTYLYVDENEAQSVRNNFSDVFVEEGEALTVASAPNDDLGLIAIYRFRNIQEPIGTYLYVTAEERRDILQDYRDTFVEEGISFYTYGVDANQGEEIFRFQNVQNPGNYLFVKEAERDTILSDFPNSFNLEGEAFEVAA